MTRIALITWITLFFPVLAVNASEPCETPTGNESLLGEWDLYLPTPDGVEKVLALFEGRPGAYVGTIKNKQGKKDLMSVKVDGKQFSFQHEVEKFFMVFTVEFSGQVDGLRLSGHIDTPKGLKSFEGVRRGI